ncbi:Peroxisomal targeting signal 2 receptor [Ceratocystis lukuohia]|uniref:Peroxin-7 n=1 Tax=Ceratocystis lukuohia TaxID=2019550 RepID=A0ABR4MN31_9PEZI
MATPMLEFRTPGFNPYAVRYSPYIDSRVAVASSANFGIVGNGKLFILGLGPRGIALERAFDTNDAQYDLAFSEINENQLIVACGDGSIKLFDTTAGDFPIMRFNEHNREALSVAWNPVTRDSFASSSWDGTVKLWSPTRNFALRTLPTGSCTYGVSFCPSNPSIISAVSSDSNLRIFDLRTPVSAKYHLTAMIPIMSKPPGEPQAPSEVLCHDWNKYDHNVIATGNSDSYVRTQDIRNPSGGALSLMKGHGYAVRRLTWSPHVSDVLISASYDMTVRLWNDASKMGGMPVPGQMGRQLGLMNRHSEFVTGVDWCLFGAGGWVASAGWDERVLLWDANALIAGAGGAATH